MATPTLFYLPVWHVSACLISTNGLSNFSSSAFYVQDPVPLLLHSLEIE